MNAALTFLLTIVILAGSFVYGITHRYVVIQDKTTGTLVIDNFDLKSRKIIERKSSGNWYALEVISGGSDVVAFEEGLAKEQPKSTKPVI
ncbi:MAG: hypothetical protein ACD_79C00466G0017 [uncultured bacterium]|nr:MAG: hypothetical protein ACD_79C00466G0017 [uncultured bacterium]